MKRNETKKQEQKNQAEQKDQQPIIRVRSGLRAGAVSALLPGCCADDMEI
jgi:hypothetical protein